GTWHGNGNWHGNGHFGGGHGGFPHHHHFHHFPIIGIVGWPFAFYPYWVDALGGYYYGAAPSQVQFGDPIPGQENCREFETLMLFQGRPVPAYGYACLQADGSWQAVY